jgi:hypothetical protein
MAAMRKLIAPAVLAAACGFAIGQNEITYTPPPFAHAVDMGNTSGNVPDVSCTSPSECNQVPLPQGGTAGCEGGKCVATAEVRLAQSINLSEQADFPAAVASAPQITVVAIKHINLWAASNTLSFDSPLLDVYVGPGSMQRETDAGAVKLGTVPSFKAGETNCSEAAPCKMAITSEGGRALANRALDFRTPFALLVVAKIKASTGQAVPRGRIDLRVQPVISFTLP